MQFFYHPQGGEEQIDFSHESVKHLKAQRKKEGQSLNVRNLKDEFLYTYSIMSIKRNEARLELQKKEHCKNPPSTLHLGWCVIEPKNIEKTLPFLNEIGLKKLSFVYSDFSQKHFKLDFKRMERILCNSCEQCGRGELMELEVFNSVDEYLQAYPNSKALDFGGESIDSRVDGALVGCEGGFSQRERELFKHSVSFDTSLILRSESAIVSLASKFSL